MEVFSRLQVPRQYVATKRIPTACFLHVFGDASPISYAAAAYIVNTDEEGTSHVSLITCRSRLAPLEAQSLPRLELLAALIATRLSGYLMERIKITFDRGRLYTDSMVTYY